MKIFSFLLRSLRFNWKNLLLWHLKIKIFNINLAIRRNWFFFSSNAHTKSQCCRNLFSRWSSLCVREKTELIFGPFASNMLHLPVLSCVLCREDRYQSAQVSFLASVFYGRELKILFSLPSLLFNHSAKRKKENSTSRFSLLNNFIIEIFLENDKKIVIMKWWSMMIDEEVKKENF